MCVSAEQKYGGGWGYGSCTVPVDSPEVFKVKVSERLERGWPISRCGGGVCRVLWMTSDRCEPGKTTEQRLERESGLR